MGFMEHPERKYERSNVYRVPNMGGNSSVYGIFDRWCPAIDHLAYVS